MVLHDSQEVYTWAFLGRELICPNLVCMCVCMYVRHAQKIAKLFFSVRSTQFPFKLNILFIKKYINLLGPKTLRLKWLLIAKQGWIWIPRHAVKWI
jgi:hypothetical protein